MAAKVVGGLCGLLSSFYLISFNMKWPILVLWLLNLIAVLSFVRKRLSIITVMMLGAYIVSYFAISTFVLRFETPAQQQQRLSPHQISRNEFSSFVSSAEEVNIVRRVTWAAKRLDYL